ncbi:hypothetical protein OROGR_004470 [Orobanche gracilis]
MGSVLSRLSKEASVEVSLGTLECEIFTISPIRVVNEALEFTPIGLIEMFNSGGANEGLSFFSETSKCAVRITVRGCGRFGAYSNNKPIHCTVDGRKEEFKYSVDNGMLVVNLEGECRTRDIDFCY